MSKPKEITANRTEKLLKIVWEDEHVSEYPFSLLRAACPCAECRGGHDKMSGLPDPNAFDLQLEDGPATSIDRLEAVGTYAITIRWQDSHEFGIYTWKFLRALCPCAACRSGAE